MISHGLRKDEALIKQYFPEAHQVYSDHYGTVWSAAHE